MKRIILLALCLAVPALAGAQDTIIFKSGEVLTVEVLETGEVVKYRLFDDPDQHVYSAGKEEISKILYHDGATDVFTTGPIQPKPAREPERMSIRQGFWGPGLALGERPLAGGEIQSLFEPLPAAQDAYQGGQAMMVFGNILAYPGSFLIGWELGAVIAGATIDGLRMGIGLGLAVGGLALAGAGYHQLEIAAGLYNESLQKQLDGKHEINMNIRLTLTGVDATLRF